MEKSRVILIIVGIAIAFALFNYRDVLNIFGGGITSDTEVEWDSCEVTHPAKAHEYIQRTYVKCTSPTKVWLGFSEGPYGGLPGESFDYKTKKFRSSKYMTENFKDFKLSARIATDLIDTTEKLMLTDEDEPWTEVFSQGIVKRGASSSENLAQGGLYARIGQDNYRSMTCVSNTDNADMCKNIAEALLFDGFASKFPE